MRHWMLTLALSALSFGCAGAKIAPPPSENCLTLKDHFRCRAPDGSHYSDPYPGKVMRSCTPVTDREAEKNFEASLR